MRLCGNPLVGGAHWDERMSRAQLNSARADRGSYRPHYLTVVGDMVAAEWYSPGWRRFLSLPAQLVVPEL